MQLERSEKEKQLPDYAWRELDFARQGLSFSGKITIEESRAVFQKWGLGDEWPWSVA